MLPPRFPPPRRPRAAGRARTWAARAVPPRSPETRAAPRRTRPRWRRSQDDARQAPRAPDGAPRRCERGRSPRLVISQLACAARPAGARSRPRAKSLGELRPWALLQLAADEDVHLLVVEGDQAGDLLALRQRRGIGPGNVLVQAPAGSHRPRLRAPLVRAVGDHLAALQQAHAHVRLG